MTLFLASTKRDFGFGDKDDHVVLDGGRVVGRIYFKPSVRCPLLALSGHRLVQCTCPLLGVKRTSAYRLTGAYVARILKGEKPADLPIQQGTKVELFINLKTAKVLNINVPLPLSAAPTN